MHSTMGSTSRAGDRHRVDITFDGPALVLTGDFTARSTFEVRNAIYERMDGLDADVVVDLTDVDVIDLTALKVLAVATRHAWQNGRHLTLRGCGPQVRRMMHLARLAHYFEVETPAVSA